MKRWLITCLSLLVALAAAPVHAAHTPKIGTAQTASSGGLTVPLPASWAEGEIAVLTVVGSTTGATFGTTPTGYTLQTAFGGTDPLAVYTRKLTASESSASVAAMSSGGIGAWIFTVPPESGKTFATSYFGTSTERTPANQSPLAYSAHTHSGSGNILVRIASKNGDWSGESYSSHATTSGYTTAGYAQRSNVAGGLLGAAEVLTAETSGGAATDDDAAITTWTATRNSKGFTFELVQQSSISVSYDAATYDLGDAFVATLTSWSTTPTSFVNQSTGNDAYSTTGTCNTSTCSGVLPDLADLVSGGAGEHTQLEVALTVRTQSGSENADDTFTINAPATGDFIASVACASASCPADSVLKLNFGAAVAGDDLYCYSPFGGATVTDYGVPSWTTTPAQLKCRLFDESANAWTAETTDDFTEETEATCAQLVRDAWRATIRDLAKEPICRSTFR